MTEDFDTDTDISPPTSLERAEADAKSDERLDATVRDAAVKAYSRDREDHDRVMERPHGPNGQSIDDTLRQTMARIQGRPEPVEMPPLPVGASMEATMEAQLAWDKSPRETQRSIANAHKELAAIKDAAASYDIKIESMSDVKAFRELPRELAAEARRHAEGRS